MYDSQISQVKDIVEKLPLPEFVRDIEYEGDEDHLGDPCVRIRVVVADGIVPERLPSRESLVKEFAPYLQINQTIADAIIKSGIDLWPYVSIIRESGLATASKGV